MQSEQVNELFAALAKAQAEMGHAKKVSENPFFKSNYADLASVVDTCRPHLAKHGLAVIHLPESADGVLVTVRCRLTHASGQWIECGLTVRPVKADPQGIGSAITYARRYTLAAIVGVATEDDDGNAASGNGGKESPAPQRAVAPKADKPTDARTAFIAAVKRWSGVSQEDLPDALKFIKAKCGVTGEKATAEELTKMHQYVLAQEKSKTDFADAMKEKP